MAWERETLKLCKRCENRLFSAFLQMKYTLARAVLCFSQVNYKLYMFVFVHISAIRTSRIPSHSFIQSELFATIATIA